MITLFGDNRIHHFDKELSSPGTLLRLWDQTHSLSGREVRTWENMYKIRGPHWLFIHPFAISDTLHNHMYLQGIETPTQGGGEGRQGFNIVKGFQEGGLIYPGSHPAPPPRCTPCICL